MTNRDFNIVVLISGAGSNLQSLINACQAKEIPATLSAVISNRAEAFGLTRAQEAGVSTHVLSHKAFPTREAFDRALAQLIDQYQPDLVVLAGFMRILSAEFVNRYLGRLINIHPSLLPKYPGLDTHSRVMQAGDTRHGASVHFVIPELDAGPVIIQGIIPVHNDDTAETLASRILTKVEHQIYPRAVQWLATGRVVYSDGGVLLDGEPLPTSGHQIHYDQ